MENEDNIGNIFHNIYIRQRQSWKVPFKKDKYARYSTNHLSGPIDLWKARRTQQAQKVQQSQRAQKARKVRQAQKAPEAPLKKQQKKNRLTAIHI
ncbi:MAG: hypothetical protein UIJ87_03925 [Anaerovoracaceae bacterium]|nr:hypothetical protein [Anaerovoracaceae bacterium]